MTKTPTTKAIAEMIVQLDLAISERLIDNPQTLELFEAYGNLLDSLYDGLNGDAQRSDYDQAVRARLEHARATLAKLGVMGEPLPASVALPTSLAVA